MHRVEQGREPDQDRQQGEAGNRNMNGRDEDHRLAQVGEDPAT